METDQVVLEVSRCQWADFVVPAVSVFIGGAITWFFAWLYFARATEDLKKHVRKLQWVTGLLATKLEHPDTTELERDENGYVVAAHRNIEATTEDHSLESHPVTVKGKKHRRSLWQRLTEQKD